MDIDPGVYNPEQHNDAGLPMSTLRKFILLALSSLLVPGLGAQAQVYQSTDAQGNVTFSDTPTPESTEVTIEKPNVGDAVEVPLPAPEPVVEPAPAVEVPQPELEGELIGSEKRSKKRRRPRKEPRGGR